MTEKKQNNPLDGLKLDVMLTEISDQYGWECLSEVLNVERFQFHTGMKSTVKFLRNNEWAKDKVENFYLYQYKNFPWPDDKQLAIAPRNRFITDLPLTSMPAEISEELASQIDRASSLRSYKVEHKKTSADKIEPPYDPSNPWNA